MFKRLIIISVLAAITVALGSLLPKTQDVHSLSGSDFNAGNIISDSLFTNKSAMTESQIQKWLEQMNSVCLKDYRTAEPLGNNKYGSQVRASRAIWKAGQLFDINPQVILVTLQKEQGLITRSDCPKWRYDTAMGFGCPDGQPCDANWFGLSRQLYQGARHFRGFYDNAPGWWIPFTTGNNYIGYHPSGSSCGGSTVNIRNRSTVALYAYTPYQPNQAALRNIDGAATGSGSECAAYGNRNFWRDFNRWFGSTHQLVYQKLEQPHVMRMAETTAKTDLRAGVKTGGEVSEGLEVTFTERVAIGGQWFFRSEWDSSRNNDLGIPLSSLYFIPEYVPLDESIVMELAKNTPKTDLLTAQLTGNSMSSGIEIQIVDRTRLNGVTYLRSKWDSDRSNDLGIPASSLYFIPEYVPLETQEVMRLKESVPKTDLRTNKKTGRALSSGTFVDIVDEVWIDGKHYYRSKYDSDRNNDLGIPAESLQGPPAYEPLDNPRDMRFASSVRKVDLFTMGQVGGTISTGTVSRFESKVQIDGVWYLRSKWDTDRSNHLGVPLSALRDLPPYEPLDNPRNMRLTQSTQKTDLLTLNRTGGTVSGGTIIRFEDKVFINGTWYLRSKWDKDRNNQLGIPLRLLSD